MLVYEPRPRDMLDQWRWFVWSWRVASPLHRYYDLLTVLGSLVLWQCDGQPAAVSLSWVIFIQVTLGAAGRQLQYENAHSEAGQVFDLCPHIINCNAGNFSMKPQQDHYRKEALDGPKTGAQTGAHTCLEQRYLPG